MTEAGAVKPKRNGARTFKNPPQPHMCIKDFMQGSDLPCYVNVLSWDKVAMPFRPNDTIPLYGGMRVSPPRGEKPEVGVFAVIANPELLKIYGKNAPEQDDRIKLINLLLEFVESKNEGVYFSRQYIILKDRDITGELKEVWMAVQAKRDRENLAPQQETWIDAQPAPAPQYPQYSDQQQYQIQLQQHQQQQQQADYAQPPQYRSNAAYSMGSVSSNESVNHEREIRFYSHQNHAVTQRENRDLRRANIPQNQIQQNCPAYPAPQYQFQQLPRQMVPQYVNSNVHSNANPNYTNRHYNRKENYEVNQNCDDQLQPMTAEERKQVNDAIRAETLRIRQQQQIQQQQVQQQQQIQQHQQIQQQLQIQQQQQPINQQGNHQQYQSHQSHQRQQQQQQLQHESEENTTQYLQRLRHRPHMGVAQKSNASKRQIESPTHFEARILNAFEQAEANVKSISPVKVLQRDSGSQEKQSVTNLSERNEITSEKSEESENVSGARNLQVTDLDQKMDGRSRRAVRRLNLDYRSRLNTVKDYVTKTTNNGTKPEQNLSQNPEQERLPTHEKTAEEELLQSIAEAEAKLKLCRNDVMNRQKTESPKRTHSAVNSVIKSVFKKSTTQVKSNAKANSNDQDEYHQAYTILKKPEASTTSGESTVPTTSGQEEEISNKLAQISIEDCKDATEVNAVLS